MTATTQKQHEAQANNENLNRISPTEITADQANVFHSIANKVCQQRQ